MNVPSRPVLTPSSLSSASSAAKYADVQAPIGALGRTQISGAHAVPTFHLAAGIWVVTVPPESVKNVVP